MVHTPRRHQQWHQQWPLSPPTLPRQQVASEAASGPEETGLEPGEVAFLTHTHICMQVGVGKYSEKRSSAPVARCFKG